MYPTIGIDDRIITTRINVSASIKRGDILVFYSDEFKETMVKRVIGLPGDSIEIDKDGSIYVNEQKLKEPYVKFSDTLSGSFQVPDEEYFFLGDYRIHSLDSRKWQDPYISEDKILGKARFVLFPFNRIGLLN